MSNQLNQLLQLNYVEDDSLWISGGCTLRRWIGILGMAMPLLLYVFLYIDTGLDAPLESISHYYFTRVSSVFVLILSVLAIFLFIYKGKEPIDFYISSIAGFFALGVVLFPTSNLSEVCCDLNAPYAVTILRHSDFRAGFHYAAAAIFLLCLAYMSICLFTKSKLSAKKRGVKKVLRNRIYRLCGVLILLAILTIFAGFLKFIPSHWYQSHQITFWMETLAIESFGFSWLVKGETLFRD